MATIKSNSKFRIGCIFLSKVDVGSTIIEFIALTDSTADIEISYSYIIVDDEVGLSSTTLTGSTSVLL